MTTHDGSDEAARDILAAEAFVMPAPDPSLHHETVVLPPDPTGIEEPHDVLAAEEFAMPAPPPGANRAGTGGVDPAVLARRAAPALVGLVLLRLLRSRRR